MGESGQLKKIERLLEQILTQWEPEHIYRGTIFEFDTVGPVPKERLVKGMLVDRKEGIRRVYFEALGTSKPRLNSSVMDVGDSVIVVGKQNPLRETTTFPLLIILPEKQIILLSQQLGDPRMKDPGENALAVLYCILIVLGVPVYLTPYLLPISWFLWGQMTLLCVVLTVLFFGIVRYQKYLRRARTIHFDRDSYSIIMDFIKHRLPDEHAQVFD